MIWVGIIIGLVVGVPLGYFLAAMCFVSGASDDASERQLRELQQQENPCKAQ